MAESETPQKGLKHGAEGLRWRIWIDTGGTFTDCLARSPQSNEPLRRAKVLSTSALRGRVAKQLDPHRILVVTSWSEQNGEPLCDDFIKGFRFRTLGRQSPTQRVTRYHAHEGLIELDVSLNEPIANGTQFEVMSDEPAPILAARLVTNTPAGSPLPPIDMRLATTRGTNALLERRGADFALFITKGFGDLLVIGDQQRPDIFALRIDRPPPLYRTVIEVDERLSTDGTVLRPLDLHVIATQARAVLAQGIKNAAIAFMHSFAHPQHEQDVARLLREIGFGHVSVSSEISPLIRLLPRSQTSAVDAYLGPVILQYLHQVRQADSRHRDGLSLHVMTSSGGLVKASNYRASDSLLSGPAGGIAGAAAAARLSGFNKIIGFDMGGTSTDVARFDGDFEYRFEHVVGGARLMSPALAIETVAAGGGSICDVADGKPTVGPQSAGATPGPACYGAGGPLTLTDVNLLLGRLDPMQFEIPIAVEPAERVANDLLTRTRQSTVASVSREELLQGFLEIANERMAAAIETVSVRQGYDPRDYALVAFGGAGGQHACAVADRLGIHTVIMPADASLLSAYGLGQAAIERFAHRQVLRPLDSCVEQIGEVINALANQAIDEVASEGIPTAQISVRRVIVNLQLLGQDSSLAIELNYADCGTNQQGHDALASKLRDQFRERYRSTYSHAPPPESQKPIEVESIRIVASSLADRTDASPVEGHVESRRDISSPSPRRVSAWSAGSRRDVAALDRAELPEGTQVDGPALVFDRRSTCVIETGWQATLDHAGALVVHRITSHIQSQTTQPELVQLELFSNRFAAIADDMGQMLQRTALSTNVKERLDFSCAILDRNGELVVNAPHIPVHLGSIGVCVRALRDTIEMTDGDVVVTNDPALGGSHLPDITVVTPVYDSDSHLIGYVANRAHHAEIGGTRPGSMPPNATTLAEEGVLIKPMHLVKRGESRFDHIEHVLRSGEFPSRAVNDNIADLRAMVAANQRGVTSLRELAARHDASLVVQQMAAINNRAEALARAAISRLGNREYQAIERLDDGSHICVCVTLKDGSAVVDFAGSADVHPGNLNATPAIVRSAVMYVLRLFIGGNVPLNEGVMRAIDLRIPHGMLNPRFDGDPRKSPAVVGGNTETSQRVVDTLLKALGLCAGSQGTMNNVLFGNNRFGYYETVCGGSGAGPTFHGTSTVHTHMTNTRITDPEIIEHRYPVRVEEFSIRRGSGGDGQFRGGDGVRRVLAFLEPMSLSVLSQHRVERPYGLAGGQQGATGNQCVVRASGERAALASIDGCDVLPGDRLVLETPGGGGYGSQE